MRTYTFSKYSKKVIQKDGDAYVYPPPPPPHLIYRCSQGAMKVRRYQNREYEAVQYFKRNMCQDGVVLNKVEQEIDKSFASQFSISSLGLPIESIYTFLYFFILKVAYSFTLSTLNFML